MNQDKRSLTIYFSAEVAEQLKAQAEREDRALSYIAVRELKLALNRLAALDPATYTDPASRTKFEHTAAQLASQDVVDALDGSPEALDKLKRAIAGKRKRPNTSVRRTKKTKR